MSLTVPPRAVSPRPYLPTAVASSTFVAAPRALALRELSSFEPAVKTQAASVASRPTAGAWRGAADSEIGRAVSAMLARMEKCPVTFKGQSAAEVFSNAILDNKKVTNEQLLAMTRVKLEDLSDSPEDRAKVLKKIPDAQQRDSHQFTVALLAGATGLDPKALSDATPSLGMTGAPGTPLLYAPKTDRMKRSTSLHDFTDYLRGAGISGLNKAVWGVENRILSAIQSAVGSWKY